MKLAVICKPQNDRQRRSVYRIVGSAPATPKGKANPRMVGGIEDIVLPVLTFVEGVNWVEESLLNEIISTNPHSRNLLTRKVLDIRKPVAETPNDLITDYSEEDREDIIKELSDEFLLKKWIAQNPGNDVEKWCQERLKEIQSELGEEENE